MPGRFVVIDGTDGSGKQTQTQLLVSRLAQEGIAHQTISFPRYGHPAAHSVQRYLRGEYGGIGEVNAHRGSLFYAIDRHDAAPEIRAALSAGTHVIADRYVGSNMGHQGSKIADPEARRAYLAWNDDLEFRIMGIPRPDLNIILHVPSEVSFELKRQAGGKDGNAALDLHENDRDHLRAAEQCYLEIATTFPGFHLIECMDGDRLRTKEEVHDLVWQTVSQLLSVG